MDCVEILAEEMAALLQKGKKPSDIALLYSNEDADLIGEALIEAQAILAGETDNRE